jgi:hypothetical protein
MLGRLRDDVVPAAVAAELVRLRDVVANARLLRDADRHGPREHRRERKALTCHKAILLCQLYASKNELRMNAYSAMM